jgi:NTE family protein
MHDNKSVKRGLVLSGGGAYGWYHVGALKALSENQPLGYDVITGVSVGALNAAFIGMHPKELHNQAALDLEGLWLNEVKTSRSVYAPWWFSGAHYLVGWWKGSLYHTKPLEALLTRLWSQQRLTESGVDVSVGAVSLESQTYKLHSLNEGNAVNKILASAAMVGLFPAVEIDGEHWLDGGLRNMIPVLDAIQKGCTEIDVITCNPLSDPEKQPVEHKRLLKVLLRGLSSVVAEVHKNDIEVAKLTAEINGIKLNVYCPDKHFTTDAFDFDAKLNKPLIEQGYADTVKRFRS